MNGIKLKYFVFVLFIFSVLVFYPSNVSAKTLATCKYENSNEVYQATINEKYETTRSGSYISKYNGKEYKTNHNEELCNWSTNKNSNKTCSFNTKYALVDKAKGNDASAVCPKVVVIVDGTGLLTKGFGYQVYGFDNVSDATSFVTSNDKINKYKFLTLTSYENTAKEETKVDTEEIANIEINPGVSLDEFEDVEANSCEEILGTETRDFLQKLFNYIKVLGPILVIILSSLDFTKTVLSGDEDSMKKSQKNLGIRLICAAGLYFLPLIVTLIINLILGGSGDQICGIK